MPIRLVKVAAAVLLTAFLASLAWRFWPEALKPIGTGPLPSLAAPKPADTPPADDRSGQAYTDPARPPVAVHKCLTGGRTVYTDDPCPRGSREQALGGGSLTVMPAYRPDALPALPKAASIPNARDLLATPGEPTLAERHLERTLQR
jgi:hypothetical protein